MTREIERRFLVDDPPAGDGGSPVRQGYLALDGEVSVRVRETDGTFRITVKGGTGQDRLEVEKDLSGDEFAALWPLTGGRRVTKTRHRIPLGPLTAELDVFEGALEGLTIVEVEFASAADADAFRPPGWFGEEISGRAEWGNAALATRGRPGG